MKNVGAHKSVQFIASHHKGHKRDMIKAAAVGMMTSRQALCERIKKFQQAQNDDPMKAVIIRQTFLEDHIILKDDYVITQEDTFVNLDDGTINGIRVSWLSSVTDSNTYSSEELSRKVKITGLYSYGKAPKVMLAYLLETGQIITEQFDDRESYHKNNRSQ